MSEHRTIILKGGGRVLVDEQDFARLSQYRWTARKADDKLYAIRRDRDEHGVLRQILMARDLIQPGRAQIKYRNGDTLDNRRENLVLKAFDRPLRVASYGNTGSPNTTNQKGGIAEAAVIAELYAHGFTALRPFDGHAPYDLVIADRSHNLRRVQVKYRAKPARAEIRVPLYTMQQRGGKSRMIPANLAFIDGYAIYNPVARRVYFVPQCDISRSRSDFILRQAEASSDPAELFRDSCRIGAEIAQVLEIK